MFLKVHKMLSILYANYFKVVFEYEACSTSGAITSLVTSLRDRTLYS